MHIPTTPFIVKGVSYSPSVINAAIDRGDVVQLVKLIRSFSGFGLIEAKQLYDSCFYPDPCSSYGKLFFSHQQFWNILLSFPDVQNAITHSKSEPSKPPAEQTPRQIIDATFLDSTKHILETEANPIPKLMALINKYRPMYKVFSH